MSPLERKARSIFDAVIADCDPEAAFERAVTAQPDEWIVGGERVDLGAASDVRILALGKPARALVRACVRSLDLAGVPIQARRGIAALPAADAQTTVAEAGLWLDAEPAGHPAPDAGSFRAGRGFLDLCSAAATPRTLVVALVGGGGSAMAEWPVLDGATVDEFAELNRRLVRSELSIREVNAIRKRISAIKGGRLAIAARPARVQTFVVSDVECGDAASVASGPTMEDDSTLDEALEAIARSGLEPSAASLGSRLLKSENLREVPKWSSADRERSRHVVLLDARDVSASASRHAARTVDVVRDLGVVDGPVESVARRHIDELASLTAANSGATCAVVSSGEATVRVRGSGSGGRNQHLALTALLDVRDRRIELADFAILSAGTDGVDGDSEAAGAVAIPELLDAARLRGLDATSALARFDSAGFFSSVGAQIVCGPTGTNVRDLRVFIGVGG